ncbi:MAG: CoA transferase [Comamonadaceae bacterium]|nr:CoA transferase [Comamonadaceae bacterium]
MVADLNALPTREGPLKGVIVLDLTRVVAGPYCTMMLADLGAIVIKIENPNDPDYVRGFPPMVSAGDEERSGFFAQYNRHKFGITLDLKAPEGRDLFLQLVERADILVENFRPGTMQKLGLDFETLHAVNPRMVFTAISGFGQTGPHASRPAFDNSAQAAGGLWSMNGAPGEPMRVGTIIGDLAASLYAAFGTLAALRQADAQGLGQLVDISQQDSVFTLTENAVVNYTAAGKVAEPLGNDHPFVRPYGRYACRDGHVFFGAYTDKFWHEACHAFGNPEFAVDPEIDSMEKRFSPDVYEGRVRPIVNAWCASRTKQELEDLAADRFPMTPIKDIAEVVADPHMAARRMIRAVDYGATQAQVFGSAVHLSSLTAQDGARAPLVGEHNELVYAHWLALEAGHMERLRAHGVI